MITFNKSKIFLFGGCDLHDIVENTLLSRDFDVIDYSIKNSVIDNSSFEFNFRSFPKVGTSLISLYTKTGFLAQRVLDTLQVSRKNQILKNKLVFDEILKFPYLEFYKKHAGPNDYLLISFSPELYTKFYSSGDCFTCVPQMRILEDPENVLHWIYKEYLTKEKFLFPFDTKNSLEWTYDLIVEFAKDIFDIFQERVLLVQTHLGNLMKTNDNKITQARITPYDLLCYRQTKIVSDPIDHNYAERLFTIIMNKFRHHYKSNLNLIKLDEPVFLDANHKWGYSIFHIDSFSRDKIAKLIYEDLVKKQIKFTNE